MRKIMMGLGLACLASTASAQESNQCLVKDSSRQISVLICQPGLDDKQLSIAGESACSGRIPCGAWVWESSDDAPEHAPEGHAGLTTAEVTTATGVFVAEESFFIRIEKSTE